MNFTSWHLIIAAALGVLFGAMLGFTLGFEAGYQSAMEGPVVSTPDPNIDSFEDCVAAGYPVMESFPRQCRTPDGRLFVEETNQPIR